MRQISVTGGAKRCRGRPQLRSDEETLHLITEAAAQEFQANGYAATSIAKVAQRAGVSTKTLYRLVPTKADLFTSVVTERISQVVLEIDHTADVSLDPAVVLERIARAYGALTLEERTIAINRLVLGESRHFPEIAATFYEKAILRIGEAMENMLRRLCALGLIALEDPHEATGMLRGMMTMEPQRAAMLGQCAAPDAEAIAARAKRCARLFLEGCAVRVEPDHARGERLPATNDALG
jgi:AcrR family transcriptional regulator